jgi:serine/threonine protein kinase
LLTPPPRQLTTRGDLDPDLDFNQLERLRVLGRGSYGEVALYRFRPGSRWPPGTPRAGEPRTGEVAVKVLLPEVATQPTAVADLKQELAILSRLTHSCLVALVGSGTRTDRKTGAQLLFIALEAVTGGDLLHKVLVRTTNNCLTARPPARAGRPRHLAHTSLSPLLSTPW